MGALIQPGKHFVDAIGTGVSGFHLFHAPTNFLFPGSFNVGGKILIFIR